MRLHTISALIFISSNIFGQSWHPMGSGTDTTIYSSIVYNNDLFVSGEITDAGGVPVSKVGKWDGESWSAAGSLFNRVNKFEEFNTELYAAIDGYGANALKKWNGTAWTNVFASSDGLGHSLAADTVNDILYVGGNFYTVNGITVNGIIQWDGSSWSGLGTGLGYSSLPVVKAMITNGSDLYVGGTFTTAGGVTVENIAKWDGTSWTSLGSGMDGRVNTLAFFNGNLYAGGEFTTAGGVSAYGLAKWDGSSWSQVGAGIDGFVNALSYDVSRNALFVGGVLVNADTAFSPGIAMWNDVNWSGLGTGVLPLYPMGVATITCHQGSVYIGGEFYTADSVVVKHIARWGSGMVWPGDANNDLIVDNNDFLEIGLHYLQSGTPRASVSSLWHPYNSADWGALQSNGSDLKHIDCDGDGLINDSDTLAISQNFTLTHAASPMASNQYRSGADLYFTTSTATYSAGQMVDVDLWLGTAATPVSSLYGISFNIDYDASQVQASTETMQFPASWLGTPGTNALVFFKAHNIANAAFGAVVRTDHMNSAGYGKVATFRFQVNSGLSAPATMNFSIADFLAVNANGDSIALTAMPHTIAVEPLATGMSNDVTVSSFSIAPNPFSETSVISLKDSQNDAVIEISDITGRIVKTLHVMGSDIVLEKGQLSNGVYFLRVTQDRRSEVKRIIIQ